MKIEQYDDKTVDIDADLKLFKRHVRVDEKTGCHIWTGNIAKDSGFARVTRDGTTLNAHRWLYKRLHGELKRHQKVRQTCGNKACVNPDHLELHEISPLPRPTKNLYKRLYDKLFEVSWAGGGGSGRFIRIVAAKDAIEAIQLVFKGSPMGRVANVKELEIKTGIIASYDFENEAYEG